MVALFDEALSDGDPRIIAAALGDIAKALGMTRLAQETGVRREALYRALSPDGNPELCTFLKVTNALGLELHATLPDSRPNPSKIPLSSLDVSPNPVPGIAKVAARKATVPKTLPPGKVVKVSSKAVPARKVSK